MAMLTWLIASYAGGISRAPPAMGTLALEVGRKRVADPLLEAQQVMMRATAIWTLLQARGQDLPEL